MSSDCPAAKRLIYSSSIITVSYSALQPANVLQTFFVLCVLLVFWAVCNLRDTVCVSIYLLLTYCKKGFYTWLRYKVCVSRHIVAVSLVQLQQGTSAAYIIRLSLFPRFLLVSLQCTFKQRQKIPKNKSLRTKWNRLSD